MKTSYNTPHGCTGIRADLKESPDPCTKAEKVCSSEAHFGAFFNNHGGNIPRQHSGVLSAARRFSRFFSLFFFKSLFFFLLEFLSPLRNSAKNFPKNLHGETMTFRVRYQEFFAIVSYQDFHFKTDKILAEAIERQQSKLKHKSEALAEALADNHRLQSRASYAEQCALSAKRRAFWNKRNR